MSRYTIMQIQYKAIEAVLIHFVGVFTNRPWLMSSQCLAYARVEAARPLCVQPLGKWAENQILLDSLFQRKLLFSNETHF